MERRSVVGESTKNFTRKHCIQAVLRLFLQLKGPQDEEESNNLHQH